MIVASLIALFVVADCVGVVWCFFGENVIGRWSAGADYAVWFVLGVFAGLLQYFSIEDACKPAANDLAQIASSSRLNLSVAVSTALLVALAAILYSTRWRYDAEPGNVYVPGSMSATITFITAIIGMMWFVRYQFRAGPSRPRPSRDLGRKR